MSLHLGDHLPDALFQGDFRFPVLEDIWVRLVLLKALDLIDRSCRDDLCAEFFSNNAGNLEDRIPLEGGDMQVLVAGDALVKGRLRKDIEGCAGIIGVDRKSTRL